MHIAFIVIWKILHVCGSIQSRHLMDMGTYVYMANPGSWGQLNAEFKNRVLDYNIKQRDLYPADILGFIIITENKEGGPLRPLQYPVFLERKLPLTLHFQQR